MHEGGSVKNKFFGFVYAMNYIAQAAWSFIFPAGLIIGLGWLLHWRLAVGQWIMVAGIVVGILVGVYSMFRYIVRMADWVGKISAEDRKRK